MSEAAFETIAPRLLRLRATDEEDLRAIATVVQDALVPVHDMSWLQDENRFVLAMNRFRWEREADADGVYERVNAGICFDNVSRVQLRGFDRRERDFILDLLTITYDDSHVILSFAGDRDVRLATTTLECRLDDFGEPWPTKSCPCHKDVGGWADWVNSQTD